MKGRYKADSSKEKLRSKFETRSYLPAVIVGSNGLVLTTRYIVTTYQLQDFEPLIMTLLCILIFYTMLFILTEQLVILYCKVRYESFNFDKDGNLLSMHKEVNEINEI